MPPLVIRHIRDPLWTKPSLVVPGGTLMVTLDLLARDLEELQVTLTGPLLDHPLAVESRGTSHNGRYQQLTLQLDEDVPTGLYGLRLEWPGGRDAMPSSVWVHDPSPTAFRFVHLADPHMASIDEKPGWGLRRAVEQINLLAPDFVLLTGDIITRYGPPQKTSLAGALVEDDMIAAQRVLLDLQVPLFLTAGNHDLGFDWCRDSYRRYMSRPLSGHTQDYAFTYRGVRFMTFEAYAYAGPRLAPLPAQAPTQEQKQWLHAALGEAQDAVARVLFFHYDYDKVLPPLYDRYRVELALFGHTSPAGVRQLGSTPTTAILDRQNRRSGHFRLIQVQDGTFDVSREINKEVVPGARALEATWMLPNDGRMDRNQVWVENRSEYRFQDLCLDFFLAAGTYAVNGAELVKVLPGDPVCRYTVRYDLEPGARRIVRIVPSANA